MIAEVDQDNEGTIDMSEFSALMDAENVDGMKYTLRAVRQILTLYLPVAQRVT
jgi:hypothetical protein